MGEIGKRFKWKMTILSFTSIVLGCGLIGVCVWDFMRASTIELDLIRIWSHADEDNVKRIRNILIDSLKWEESSNITKSADVLKLIEEKLEEIRPLWKASCVAGMICGSLQAILSLWLFIILFTASMNKKMHSETWLKLHIFLMIAIFGIFGLIYISGFYPDVLVVGIFSDFLMLNFFIWVVVPLLTYRNQEEYYKKNVNEFQDGPFIQIPYVI